MPEVPILGLWMRALNSILPPAAKNKPFDGSEVQRECVNNTVLPLELIQKVLDSLALEGDLESLRALSLAARVFRAPCQEILFRNVIIDKPHTRSKEYSPCRALLQILRHSPNLLRHIKSVTVRRDAKYRFQLPGSFPPLDGSLTTLLSLLSQQSLKHIRFDGWHGMASAPKFQSAILRLLGCPTLEVLALDLFPFEGLRVVTSPSITKVLLTVVPVEAWPNLYPSDALVSLPGLQELEIHAPDSRRLSRNALSSLLLSCAPSLRVLRGESSVFQDPLMSQNQMVGLLDSFRRMVCLETLTLDCWCNFTTPEGHRINPYTWIPQFLLALPPSNSLSTISLRLQYSQQQEIDVESPWWHEVDETLSSKDRFPHFSNIIIHLSPFPTRRGDGDDDSLVPSIEGHFPRLHDAGRLDVIWSSSNV